jgi:hypothetical protein
MNIMKWLCAGFVPVLFVAVTAFTVGAQAQTASNNPSTAKMGIDHSSDPEPVFVQDASKIWAQMGSVNKTTHAFTPVGGAAGGGGGGGLSEGPWGSPPPGYATYIGILADPSGNMIGPKGSIWGTPPNGGVVLDVNANVLNVAHIICDSGCSSGTGGSGSNASVGAIPGTAPASATYMGMLVNGGGMVGVSGSPWGTAPTGLNVLGVNAQILGTLPGFATPPSFNCASGCTSGGGPVTAANNSYADGALVTMGTKADPAWTTGAGSEIAILKTIASSVAALPPNASTASNQTSGSQKTQIVDSGGTVIGSTSGGFNVNCIAGCSGGSGGSNASVGVVSPPAPAPTSATLNGMAISGGNMVAASGSVWGTAPTTLSVFGVNANVLSSVLPPNAATASGQPALNADGGANAHIMNFPATQPISAAALPLPPNAATASAQPAINGDGGSQTHVMNFPTTQAVSLASAPLAANAATAANQNSTAPGTSAAAAQGVQGVTGGVPFLTNPGTASLWGLYGQGAATSGQIGGLMLGAVTTAAPGYTTGNSSPVSLTAAGELRVNCTTGCTGGGGGGTSSNFGSTYPTAGTAAGFQYLATPPTLTNNTMVAGQADVNGYLKVDCIIGCVNTAIGGTPQTTNSAPISISSATTTQIIPALASNYTYITQLNVMAGSAGGLTLEYGTGTNCGTGTTVLTGAYPWPAFGGVSIGTGFGPTFGTIPINNAVCIVSTGAPVQLAGSISYTQSTTLISPWGGPGGSGGGGGGGGSTTITGPLGPSTPPASAVAITDTGAPITGQTLGSGGQGLVGWLSQVVANMAQGVFTPGGTAPAQGVATGGLDINGLPQIRAIAPCDQPNSYFDFATAAGTGQLVAGVAGKKIYLCAGTTIVTSTAAHVSFIEGSGSSCTTPVSVYGNAATVAATSGMAFAANGGVQLTGTRPAATQTTGNALCVLFDTANSPQVNVHVAYVQK